MADKEIIQKRVAEMSRSLLDEGYHVIFKSTLPGSIFHKLRHRKNGHVITIVGTYSLSRVRLFRDGRLRHTENL